ncbi:MAG: hypothetical protein ABFR47_06500 [Verrucomicrobiota bacterium]
MKNLVLVLAIMAGLGVNAGQLSLPAERLALPEVQGSHLVCIWDAAANDWHSGFASYDHSGSLDFQVPEWGKWYWVGLWDEQAGEYVFGKWIGHFVSE